MVLPATTSERKLAELQLKHPVRCRDDRPPRAERHDARGVGGQPPKGPRGAHGAALAVEDDPRLNAGENQGARPALKQASIQSQIEQRLVLGELARARGRGCVLVLAALAR